MVSIVIFYLIFIILFIIHAVQPVSDESFEFETHLTATVIVMTLLAAVTLVSFIGVVIILVIINRRLKTAKTIRGTPTKSTNKGP